MSGPQYPPPPFPNSNEIGGFAIGVSPIGDIAPFNPWSTVIDQYANSDTIDGLILSFNAAMDQTQNFDNFFDFMWNVLTAQGYGLDAWGRIVGVTRTLQLPGSVAYLGFEEAMSWTGFNQGSLYSGGAVTSNFNLSDSDFRTLILAKALGNVSDGSIPSVNAILLALFPNQGRCYVQDNLNMSVTYVFEFPLTPVQLAIVAQEGVLPTAAGVAVTIQQV